ncbi:DNA adenine methylase [Bacillus phage vB_BceH_LY2]|nr:DNA adenine methylase [Bacillus phage vB_BceH_LY2]
MRYFGGKQRISKELTRYLNTHIKDGQPFVDLFCGSCNVISKINKGRVRVGNDKHPYLISMWLELQKGMLLPDNITKDEYLHIKENLDENKALSGFVGFGLSFGGKWFGGYAKSGERNYCMNAKNSTMRKMKNLEDVTFTNEDYRKVNIPKGSLVYCDIPYENVTGYDSGLVGEFNHDEFYKWVDENKHNYDILISEYQENVRDNYKIVWSKDSKQDMRNKDNVRKDTTEVLITPK